MLDIVTPVWNHWKTTARCLASIFKSDIPMEYRVIIVNDASTDHTKLFLDFLIRKGNPISVIDNQQNIGYILSTNSGLKFSTADYILLLNNDTVLEKGCIKKLLENTKKHQDIGVLSATEYTDEKLTHQIPLKTLLRGENATTRDHMVEVKNPLNTDGVIYCDLISFACVLITRKTLETVGYYDEYLKLGCYEQEDYILRTREANIPIAICPEAKFYHERSISTKTRQDFSLALEENRKKFFEKWGQKLKENKI